MNNEVTFLSNGAIHKKVLRLMGNRFEITVVNEDKHTAEQYIDAAIDEIKRIEKLLTTFSENSQTNQINAAAGKNPVKVDREVFDIIYRANKIAALTQGAFDITYGSIDKRFWNFDTTMTALPDRDSAKQAVRFIDYKKVILDEKNCTVFLQEEGMRIGFGGIGKGYAAERAKYILQQLGVQSGIINAAGDLTAWGRQPDGDAWTIGIADPDSIDKPFSFFDINNMAVATSGNYEKYVMIDDKKYSHTINPKTGYPVKGIKSVTIICPNAEIADAMTTPVIIMGIDAGLNMINQMKGIACIIIDDDDNLYTSENIKLKAAC